MGAIPASFLPPRELWPDRVHMLPEHARYPARLNSTEFCRDRIAVYKWPREVALVPQLPRAPGPTGPGTGKLLRRVLREQAERV